MKFINKINVCDKKEKCILVGKGPSIDKLNIGALKKQKEFDICTISDAMRLFPNHKFSIHYHFMSIKRCQNVLNNVKYLLCNANIPLEHKDYFPNLNWEDLENMYIFHSKHMKIPEIINKKFDLQVNDTLSNYCGSVVGAINFLFGYMNYKEIYYVGFDGGIEAGKAEYANAIYYKRKESKIAGCKIKYVESWKGTQHIVKHYPEQKFLPLKKFIKR